MQGLRGATTCSGQDSLLSSFLSTGEYLSLPRDPQKWVIKDLIPVGGLTNIYGKPKAGKSFAALGMAIAVSSGSSEWLGFPVLKHGPVAYLQIDTPRSEWADRLTKCTEANHNTSAVFHCDMLMTKTYPVNVLDPDQVGWLKTQLQALQPVLVIIDTLREAHGEDENNSTVMRNVVTNLVSASMPASVILLSHSRKDTILTQMGGDDLMSDARGSSYVAGRMDVVIKMTGNGDHATGLQYRGRSDGRGKLSVNQDEVTGLIVLDGESAAYMELVRNTVRALREADPKASVNAMAETLAEQTSYRKITTIRKDIKAFLSTEQAAVRHLGKTEQRS